MIKVYQIELSDEKVRQVNMGGGWTAVEWGQTYLDLTMGKFYDSDNVSVMEMIIEAIEFGLVKHTMTLDTDDFDNAFALGNGMFAGMYVDQGIVEHCQHKSASVGDIMIRDNGEGVVVATFGFEELQREEVKEIEMLVPQHFEFTKDV